MHACPRPMRLGIVVYSNALLHVSLFVVDRFVVIFTLHTGRTFTCTTEGLWKTRALGEGCRHPSLQNTNTKQGDVVGCRDHEGWVPFLNATLCIRQTLFHLCADQRFPVRREGHVGLQDPVHLIKQVHRQAEWGRTDGCTRCSSPP